MSKCNELHFSLSDSFAPYREEIEIPEDTREMRLDVILMRDDPQHWSSANDFRVIENVVKTRYHSNPEIRQRLAELETRSGQIATFGYAESEFGIYYNSIKLTADVSIDCYRLSVFGILHFAITLSDRWAWGDQIQNSYSEFLLRYHLAAGSWNHYEYSATHTWGLQNTRHQHLELAPKERTILVTANR